MSWLIAWAVFEVIMLACFAYGIYTAPSDVELWGEEIE